MTRRIVLALVLAIVVSLGAACAVKRPRVGWYRYRINGVFAAPVTFYSPVAIPFRYISWAVYKVKPPRLGTTSGIGEHDCLQSYTRRRPKGWNSDR